MEGTPAYKLEITRKIGRTDYMFPDAQSFLVIKPVRRTSQRVRGPLRRRERPLLT